MVNIQQYCVSCENAIEEKTRFKVKIVEQQAKDFISGIQDHAEPVPTPQALPEKCIRSGCIPCALWHMSPLHRTTIATSLQNDGLAENVEATSSGSSSYRSVTALYKPDLNAALGLPPDDVGSFMLHYQGDGCPHCVPVQFSHGKDSAMVLDGRNGFKVSTAVFQEAVASAVDRSTIVSYWQRQPRGKPGPEATCLLDMKAGSSDMIAGAASDDSEDDVAGDVRGRISSKFSLDEEDNPVVSDGIRQVELREDDCVRCVLSGHLPSFASCGQHVEKHHVYANQFVCSGTKPVKVILAMFDHAASSQVTATDLLQQNAALLRETVRPALKHNCNHIDKQIRLILDAAGPRYVRTMATRCHKAALEHGNRISTLLPGDASHWLPLLDDISTSNEISQQAASLELNDEWHYVSMDATVKVCLKLLGQEAYRAPKTVRDAALFRENTAWRCLLTVRGRSGAVLLHPLQNESSEQLVEAFAENFSTDQLGMIVHVATDSPSEKLYTQLRVVCPKLGCVMLDPIPLAIVYEYGLWNKRSAGSKQLRRILSKCVATYPDTDSGYWSLYYDGTMPRFRAMILHFSMALHEADSQLDGSEWICRFATCWSSSNALSLYANVIDWKSNARLRDEMTCNMLTIRFVALLYCDFDGVIRDQHLKYTDAVHEDKSAKGVTDLFRSHPSSVAEPSWICQTSVWTGVLASFLLWLKFLTWYMSKAAVVSCRREDQYLADLKPYKNEYEYAAYGYNVGCNKLGEYPFPMHQVYYPNAIWYTMPGACPNNLYYNKDNSCQASQPGGYCPGVEPNGNGTCTWNYEEAGEISLDELVGIKDYASWRHGHREYDPETDEGIKFSWWNGINSTAANEERVRQAAELFDRRNKFRRSTAASFAARRLIIVSDHGSRAAFAAELAECAGGDVNTILTSAPTASSDGASAISSTCVVTAGGIEPSPSAVMSGPHLQSPTPVCKTEAYYFIPNFVSAASDSELASALFGHSPASPLLRGGSRAALREGNSDSPDNPTDSPDNSPDNRSDDGLGLEVGPLRTVPLKAFLRGHPGAEPSRLAPFAARKVFIYVDRAELANPPCDFDFGSFYKEWYRKDGYVGPCGPPNANCKGGIGWIRHEGLSQNPEWYVPLTASASDDEIQRLLYQLGKNECLRPCERGETPTASTPPTATAP
ncbi:unnamed protein product [Symbiodinium microadriaticum]|nr:unnamed protein product [Symbiodinium microadriaticum]